MNSTTVATTVTSATTTSAPIVAVASDPAGATTAANAANNSTTNVSNQLKPNLSSDQIGNVSSSPNQMPPQQTTQTSFTSPATASNLNNGNKSKPQQAVTSNGSLTDSVASTEGHRTPNLDLLSKTNLYIRGLQSNTSDQDLYKMCSRYGSISSTKAILDKTTGCCRGYGFVEFTSAQSAEFAVKELTKSGIQAQMAKISPLYSSHHNHHHNNNNNNNNHHQHHQNHHHNTTNNHNSNPNNSVSGGSGGGGGGTSSGGSSSINNTNSNSITSNTHPNAASNDNSSSQQHQQHYQNFPNNNNADPTNLYIANLPPNMSEIELENLLSTYGPVVSTRILRDQSNIPRGVGFARMETRDKCEQIIEQLNGRPCKGWNEPLLVKFADAGTKKRNHHHNHHQQHQHHNTNHHHQSPKSHQDESRWRESSSNASDLDLAIMNPMGYPRIQPGFPAPVAPGSAYPPHLCTPTSAPQWIHHGAPGQPYVFPQQMIQAAGLGPPNQAAAAAAAALHYGHIPQLTSQMQGLQISHPGAIGGYLPPHHQWPGLWTHPISPQSQASMRLATPGQPPPSPHQPSQHMQPRHHHQQQQPQQSPQASNMQQHHQPSGPTQHQQQQQSAIAETKHQISMPL